MLYIGTPHSCMERILVLYYRASGDGMASLLSRLLECGHVTDQVEGLLFPLVIHTIYEVRQPRDGCLKLNILPGAVSKELCHEEGLRQESLYLTCAVHYEPVIFGELI